MLVDLKFGGIGDEDKGSILIDHPNETRAARAPIEPQYQWVVIWVVLGVEEHIVEGPCILALGEVEIS